MNKNKAEFDKQTILAVITFSLLTFLIIIQVSWIYRAALLEEQNFNHRVAMALKYAKIELGNRAPYCEEMTNFLCGRGHEEKKHVKKYWEVDSIIRSSLNAHKIELPFTFELTDTLLHYSKGRLFTPPSYTQNLNGLTDQSGFQIKVEFPTRNQFLIGQIMSQLGLSIVFILFVMYAFLASRNLYKREKALLLRTTDFINNMVHEFQTPIANVRFATNLIKKQKDISVKTNEYSEVILEETKRLQHHVEEILRVGCSEHNDCDLDDLDMHELIENVIQSFKVRLTHSNATIRFKPDAENALIKGEYGPVSLVISNLIDNALKYVAKKPIIEINTTNMDSNLIIKITDNGIGIKKEDQQQVFEKFYRVSTGNVHNVKGFGMGLTYAKKVTDDCGGSIELESNPGKGSVFTLIFPVTRL
ncbi:sensor histidine kinase [Natronoflexus pectinivorans]|uniref:histidine kinase n=1 Tax=Natronoflexus pectinivorans TaxID=682526 RepID=A0A4R2GIA7_9BACT|nr:HAMP domain-containing sensor histidine kinase [Natronoflexus pectinivorans]TCO08290.1 phospho-acceptor domain-containing protein [Natronoflexus pectinivorans]